MSKFSRWTPTLGVCFKWDSQKVLKIAHFGVFRHIGGTGGVQKHMYLKIYWVKVISSKNGDFWTPSAERLIFSDKTFACLIDCTPKLKDFVWKACMWQTAITMSKQILHSNLMPLQRFISRISDLKKTKSQLKVELMEYQLVEQLVWWNPLCANPP